MPKKKSTSPLGSEVPTELAMSDAAAKTNPGGAPSTAPEKPPRKKNVSPKQREANQRNGAKSKGPRTAKGKAASSKNATKHGLNSTQKVLKSERREEYDSLYHRFVETERPANGTEEIVCEKVIDALWLGQRHMRASASGLAYFEAQVAKTRAYRRLRRSERNDVKALVEKIRKENIGDVGPTIIDPLAHEKALEDFDGADDLLLDDSTLLGEALFEGGLEFLERLNRNYGSIDRSGARWLQQLRREQKARGKQVEVSPVVELDCTIERVDKDDDDE